MKKFLFFLSVVSLIACSFSSSTLNVEAQKGKFDVPAKGEFRMWQGVSHPRFSVTLVNPSPNQSCEVYFVKSDGTEKWVNPSLLANSNLTVSIPTDGHLFIKNFNGNPLPISYEIK